ncbi:hypothetical protein FZC35_01725 [Candidatus Cytomitobacter indipagum]|uniref:Uncharacterized protein n=2 Tax=Candidatus Cytomitobacter indipagum TaxID=2601575 RepID=A0A5C0UEA6_9PROT|nr:hypothetical protein FZC35_01725 [Candidatus Cytomitobacter indipagum]
MKEIDFVANDIVEVIDLRDRPIETMNGLDKLKAPNVKIYISNALESTPDLPDNVKIIIKSDAMEVYPQ